MNDVPEADVPGADASQRDGLQRYVELAADVTRTTLGATERLLAQFVRQGEVAADHAERLLEEVIARSAAGSGALAQLVRSEVERAVARGGVDRAAPPDGPGAAADPWRADVDGLRAEVTRLRAELDGVRAEVAALRASGRQPGGVTGPQAGGDVADSDAQAGGYVSGGGGAQAQAGGDDTGGQR